MVVMVMTSLKHPPVLTPHTVFVWRVNVVKEEQTGEPERKKKLNLVHGRLLINIGVEEGKSALYLYTSILAL